MNRSRRAICCSLLAALVTSTAAADGARLQNRASAFLRSHAGSPVDWHPWGAEAFTRAREQNKPLYVVVGAFTSELSRAMRQQSFSNPEMAAKLNEAFVCVLVDRDEFPEVASLLQAVVGVTKQVHGWPLNVWMTPGLAPYEAAVYLPPSEEWGSEGLPNVVNRAVAAWQNDAAGQRAKGEQLLQQVGAIDPAEGVAFGAEAVARQLDAAAEGWRAAADKNSGGFGEPPRSLEPELIRFLLARGGEDRELAIASVRALCRTPLHDPLDGGFYRGSIDAAGKHPIWARTAADQARIALALLETSVAAGDDALGEAARAALRFTVDRFQNADGGFITSEDALAEEDAAGMTWTQAEILEALGDAAGAAFAAAHGATAEGNIGENDDPSGRLKGRNILSGGMAADLDSAAAAARLAGLRNARVRFARDENVRAGVNGLVIAALSRAGHQLQDPQLLAAAERAVGFVRTRLYAGEGPTLRRLAGSEAPAGPDDYVLVAFGLAEYSGATQNHEFAREAETLLQRVQKDFLDAARGLFVAAPQPSIEGWPRVPMFVPGAGDPPTTEHAALAALIALPERPSWSWAEGQRPAWAEEFLRVLKLHAATALGDDAAPPRGDVLLSAHWLIKSPK